MRQHSKSNGEILLETMISAAMIVNVICTIAPYFVTGFAIITDMSIMSELAKGYTMRTIGYGIILNILVFLGIVAAQIYFYIDELNV